MVVPYRHWLMIAYRMIDGNNHPFLLTKNYVDSAGINPLTPLSSQSCGRGLQQIISIPLSPLHYSLVVGELQQMLILYNPLVSAILFTIYRL